jgi:hypothetical protein
MLIVACPKCLKGKLVFDPSATYNDYYKTENYVVDKHGELVEETVQNYLVYSCDRCESEFKYTHQELDEMIRKQMAQKVIRMKNLRYIKENVEPADLKNSNIIIFCGECDGFDGKGNCPDRFFNRCEIRTKAHGIQLP